MKNKIQSTAVVLVIADYVADVLYFCIEFGFN